MRHSAPMSITSRPTRAAGSARVIRGCGNRCTAPVPGAEVCDNADNNCDGQIDENVTQSCYTGPAGTLGVGACHGGPDFECCRHAPCA